MAGAIVVDQIQLGDNGTPANNFVIQKFNDGTMKIQRGNIGGSLTDILTIDNNGKPVFAWEVAAGNQSLSADGYQRLSNGLIFQWGTYPNTASGTKTFPITFPNLCASCVLTPRTGTDADIVTALTTANFQWANGGTSTPNGYFIAIGY